MREVLAGEGAREFCHEMDSMLHDSLVFENDARPAHFIACAKGHDLDVALIGLMERLGGMMTNRSLPFKHSI